MAEVLHVDLQQKAGVAAAAPTAGAPPPQNPSPAEIQEAWSYYQHADNLFHTRQNIFLVAHTILLTAFVTISSENDQRGLFRLGLAIMGAVAGLNWFFVVKRLRPRLKELSDQYLVHSKVYDKYLKAVDCGRLWDAKAASRELLLPVLFTASWFALLFSMKANWASFIQMPGW